MKQLIKDEQGLSLVELIAGLGLLSLILIPLSLMLSISANSVDVQKEQAEIQSITNLMVAQMIDISQNDDLYKRAGYKDLGHVEWDKNMIIQVDHNGERAVQLTDILDTTGQRKKTYQMSNPDMTIHINQEKNKNSSRKSNQHFSNSRDSFTVQNTVTIQFKKKGKVVYSQDVELEYRDEDKARGDIGGDGWW